MSDSCELCAAEGGPVAHMHVHQVPGLVYTDAGFIYEGHPMKVLGLTTKDRGTDNPGLEIRMVTMEEYRRRRASTGLAPDPEDTVRDEGIEAAIRLGRHMQDVATVYRSEFMGSRYVCDAAVPSGCAQCGEDAAAFAHNPDAVSRTGVKLHQFEPPSEAMVKQRMATRAQHRNSGECRVCAPGTAP